MKTSVGRGSLVIVGDQRVRAALPDLDIVSADDYLVGERSATVTEESTVINLCRSYDYLSRGYYVSLVAEARHQRAYPASAAIEELRHPHTYFLTLREAGIDTIQFRVTKAGRLLPDFIVPDRENEERAGSKEAAWIKSSPVKEPVRYEPVAGDYVEVSSVFGRTTDPRFRKACAEIFKLYRFPVLGIRLYRQDERWKVGQLFARPLTRLDRGELALLRDELTSKRLIASPVMSARARQHRLAVLMNEGERFAPSDAETFKKLKRAGGRLDVVVEEIDKGDLATLGDYDALFIRTLSGLDHYSFAFAQKAESLGIPVIDRPLCTMRCSNKIYLHELFIKNRIPTPATVSFSRSTRLEEVEALGYPLILKQPDGTFSAAVKKANERAELEATTQELFKRSPLLIAQEFTPTPFDWRVGVLDGRILYACRYFMVKGHWQIVRDSAGGRARYGKVEAIATAEAPKGVTALALKAANLVGDGLYGVDLKETEAGPIVIEVNDNPDLWVGEEDAVEGDRLYETIIDAFLKRIEATVLRDDSK